MEHFTCIQANTNNKTTATLSATSSPLLPSAPFPYNQTTLQHKTSISNNIHLLYLVLIINIACINNILITTTTANSNTNSNSNTTTPRDFDVNKEDSRHPYFPPSPPRWAHELPLGAPQAPSDLPPRILQYLTSPPQQ